MRTEKIIRVYTASKISQAPLWKRLQTEWPEIEFTARWVVHHAGHTPDEGYYAQIFWQQDHEDIIKSDALMLYGESGEKLRGGLVEAGMALALGKPVVVVGSHDDYGTWQYHRGVHRVPGLNEARMLLNVMSVGSARA